VAVSAAGIYLATVAPRNWAANACDAYSSFHLVTGLTGGLGLAAVTFLPQKMTPRAMGIAVLAAGFLAVVAVFFPHCLENPLASLDPRLKTFWLEGVVETRSLADLWATDPFAIPGLYGMAACAFVLSIVAMVTGRALPLGQAVVFAAFLAMGIAVTAWQQRGFTFAAAFAVLPLGFWIGRMRAAMPAKRATGDSLRLAGAWLISVNLVWWIGGAQAAQLFSTAPTLQEQAAAAPARDYCYTPDLYAPLAAEPDGVVLGATSIGASILLYTHHRTIAGPYHRNMAGNLFLIDTMLAAPETARAMLHDKGVTIVADCVNAADGRDFIRAAPQGFQALLRSGHVPDWLEPVKSTIGQPLVLYRVRP
jgi:hypothetical protein